MELSLTRRMVTAQAAQVAVTAAVGHGHGLGKAVVAAVVDASGDLVVLMRGDGAFKASISIAQDKAYTAAVFGLATEALSSALSGNRVLQDGIARRSGVVLFGGGLPLLEGGVVIGGIGVSGGSEDDDRACARAGLTALGLG